MITKDSELRVNVNRFLSHKEKQKLISELKEAYGVQVVKINDIPSKDENVSSKVKNAIEDDVKLQKEYEKVLSKHEYDEELFKKIDEQVLSYVPDIEVDYKQNYEIKYFRGKNLLSYGSFEFDTFGVDGINVVYSEPQNFGGKSNFYKLFQVLLWGEFQGVGSKSSINDLPNKFLNKNAYIEGVIAIDTESYFIRRDYVKRGKKYNHNFNLFLLTEQADADCFIVPDEHGVEVIDLNVYNPSMEGFFAKNLNTKNTAETKKEFTKKIGTIDDFTSNCYFDQLNINSLLLEKPTARTREFYNLFGGKFFEQKRDIAKDILYKKFKETSLIHSHNVNELKDQIKSANQTIQQLESQQGALNSSINQLEQNKDEKTKQKESFIYELKEIEEGDISALSQQKQGFEQNLRSVKENIKTLLNSFTFKYTASDYELFKQQEQSLIESLNDVCADVSLQQKLKEAESKNSEQLSSLEKQIDNIKSEKIEIKANFSLVKNRIAEIEKEISSLDEPQKCPHCGKAINDVAELKAELTNKLNTANNEKEQLISRSHKLVEEENQITTQAEKLKTEKEELVEKIKNQIDIDVKNKQKNINDEIKEKREKIEAYNQARQTENQIDSKKVQVNQLLVKIEEIDAKLRRLNANKSLIEHNEKIKAKIAKIESEISSIDKALKEHYQRLNVLYSDLSRHQLLLKQNTELLSRLSDDIKMDGAYNFYIKMHDKDGIIKNIIASYLDEINEQLKEPLSALHFDIEIKQVKGIIEYFKIDKKTKTVMALSEASNFERFISIAALHLVRLKYSTAMLSNIMFFDEVFAQTHDDNVPILYSALEMYKDLFQIVMVISHKDSVKKLADNEIKISKKDNVSLIEKF